MRTRHIVTVAVFAAALMIPGLAWSQAKVATTGYQFLEIGVGARAIGMGEAFVALADDASAIYYNPAGLTALTGPQVTFDYLKYVADIDYASFCSVAFTDFKTGDKLSRMSLTLPHRFEMPEHVERSVSFRGRDMEYSNLHRGNEMKVDFSGRSDSGEDIEADFLVRKPEGHESLDIVVPWTSERFQMNSKHNTLPCEGQVTVAGKKYVMDPGECHGVQDFGRGMWPYRSFWNWGVCTGVQDGNLIGVNMGAKWTTGTGSNENGICFNGRLYKVMEDLIWSYDPNDWMKPWRVRSDHSDIIDLTLHPVVVHSSQLILGVVSTGGACPFGHWSGTIRFDGNEVMIDGLIGWVEEFAHRW